MIRIGVDFGGTKIEVAALGADGAFLARQRAPNPGDYGRAIATVRELVAAIEARAGTAGSVGIGIPGSISPRTGLVRNANSTYLNGRPFREDLALALGRELRMANDANCLALSEAVDGAATGARTVFAVILGTGCGGGLVVDGRLVEGAHGIAGEWGHVPLPWARDAELDPAPCWCGRRGCLETWISGPALERDHRAAGGDAVRAPGIVAAARAGDPVAAASIERWLDRTARGLAMVVDLFDPDVLVFGGGLSNVAELYAGLPERMRPWIFADTWQAQLAAARWGDSSGVRGAARLW
ncbi:MAG: ROK family protein [Steroidobacteraceae bacterium]|jgi:fructokinase|nr:ROK family protein [Steroidobacteraceae bacterium]